MTFRALKLSNLENVRALKASNLARGTTSVYCSFIKIENCIIKIYEGFTLINLLYFSKKLFTFIKLIVDEN